MKGFIYKYTFPDGKVYIGQTRRIPSTRDREHFDENIGKANPLFWAAYQKLGKPRYEIIETIEFKRVQELVAALNETETKYIALYDSTNPEHGYNIRSRGTVAIPRDLVLAAEFERIWNEISEDWNNLLDSVSNKCFHTFEPLNEEERVFCEENLTDEDNIFAGALLQFGFDFNNLAGNSEDALFWLDECISYAIFRFRDSYECMICHYIEQNKERILSEHSPETTIVQIDKKGKVVREYTTPAELREALNKDDLTNVYNVLVGKQKHAYGYVWRYKKDLIGDKPKAGNGQLVIDFGS